MKRPDTPTPIGCVVGLFAIPFAIVSGLFFKAAHIAFTMTPPKPTEGWDLIFWGIMTLLPALLLIVICIYRLWTTGERKFERYSDTFCS